MLTRAGVPAAVLVKLMMAIRTIWGLARVMVVTPEVTGELADARILSAARRLGVLQIISAQALKSKA